MKYGFDAASKLVGFPEEHSRVISLVARHMNTVIAFRDVGTACTGLLREGYDMKGFRIDTKSCDWGPMAGFVCADPRLNKRAGNDGAVAFNLHETEVAVAGLPGHATLGIPGPAELARIWSANYGPLVISVRRIDELRQADDGHISGGNRMRIVPSYRGKHMVGQNTRGGLTVHWRLIHIDAQDLRMFTGPRTHCPDPHYYAICADPPFRQWLPEDARPPFLYQGYEVLLGLCNPGIADDYGFKACVTGDYDLFCVWPHAGVERSATRVPTPEADGTWDQREIPVGMPGNAAREHWQLGNISRRIKLIKVMLNSRILAAGHFPTIGQLVHHSDEVGNPGGLARPLRECFPIIAFMGLDVYGLETTQDLREFALRARAQGFVIELKPAWWGELNL
jgi:hypothetical protein